MTPPLPTVDDYFAALQNPAQKQALTELRGLLKTLLPDHIEVISYAMPGFRQPHTKGKIVAGYAAFAKNCGYYPHSGNIIPRITGLDGYKTTAGAIQFTPDHRLPADLIRRLVQARQAELQ